MYEPLNVLDSYESCAQFRHSSNCESQVQRSSTQLDTLIKIRENLASCFGNDKVDFFFRIASGETSFADIARSLGLHRGTVSRNYRKALAHAKRKYCELLLDKIFDRAGAFSRQVLDPWAIQPINSGYAVKSGFHDSTSLGSNQQARWCEILERTFDVISSNSRPHFLSSLRNPNGYALDVVRVFQDLGDAEYYGNLHRQGSIYCIHESKEIELAPFGVARKYQTPHQRLSMCARFKHRDQNNSESLRNN